MNFTYMINPDVHLGKSSPRKFYISIELTTIQYIDFICK